MTTSHLRICHPAIDLSIVTWNSERWITGFFSSLLNQYYPTTKINLFIRDNGSVDGTLSLCEALIAKHERDFISITIDQGDNVGFGQGHNLNFAKGNARFFLVANVDIEFLPNAIDNVLRTAVGDVENTASWEFRQCPFEHPKLYNPVDLTTNWSSSACVLFRRTAFASVGGYEKKIFMYGEDVELSYRLRDHGYTLKYCPSAVCRHHTYEYANQIKPLQFFGSTLANVLIRCRYGSVREIIAGFLLFFSLWFRPPPINDVRSQLFRNFLKLLADAPYFLRTRKKSINHFPFHLWDYELRRIGAFYQFPEIDWNQHQQPLISIIVRTYAGRLEWLKEATASVMHQTWPRIELIVIEDGSKEAETYISDIRNSSHLESVRYAAIEKGGRCIAGNHGLSLAHGDYVGFLDDDDLLLADHVETLATELECHPDYGLAYAIGISARTEVTSIAPLSYRVLSLEIEHAQTFSKPILWHHNYIPIQCALFRRSLYNTLGGFDLDLENLEDWNLWTRYATATNFLFIEKATSIYRTPPASSVNAARQEKLDKYYAIAKSKQKDMRFLIAPDEFEHFARNNYVFAMSHSWVRKIIVAIPLLRPLLWPARITSRIIRKLRHSNNTHLRR